jgi:bifunctional DNase/RNase
MTVYGFTMDSVSRRPVVLLKGPDGNPTVPLWITIGEGVSIAADMICRDLAAGGGKADFLNSLLKRLRLKLSRITFDRDESGTISATVCLSGPHREQKVDVTITEALNMALTKKTPLLVSSELVDWATRYALSDEEVLGESNERRYADFLENIELSQMNKLPI